MDIDALKAFLSSRGFPEYRFRQVTKNYFSGRYQGFEQMTDLPAALRQHLSASFPLYSLKLSALEKSPQAIKARLVLSDGLAIETVLMDYGSWLSVCLSTQVGCSLGCRFCATGVMGFKRNLSVEEIVDQLLFWRCHLSENGSPQKISRVVFMGMGEPFLNWDNLVASLKIINSPSGCFIGQRKISVSTAGIVPRIYDFTRLNTQINLAISLHSLKNHVRTSLMPVNRQFPLPVLLDACFNYVEQTKRQLFFEYVLIRDVNDSPSDLSLLVDFLRSHRLFFLNLIPANPVLSKIVPSPSQTVNRFTRTLSRLGPNFTLRRSLGADISAACGQLATK